MVTQQIEGDGTLQAELLPGIRLRGTPLKGHIDQISRIAWSLDGQRLASASRDRTVIIWKDGEIEHKLMGHQGWVIDVAWSPDGQQIATCSEDRTVRVWDTTTGNELKKLKGHTGTVKAVAWSPDGTTLASGAEDKTVRLWDLETEEPRFVMQGHTGGVFCVEWSPDGKYVASGSDDGMVRLWLPKYGKTRRILRGHTKSVYSLSWSPESEMLASASNDKTIRVWCVRTVREITVLEGHTKGVNCVSYSWNGRILASKADGVRLWCTSTWQTLAVIPEADINAWPPGLAFHPTAPLLATLDEGENKAIRLWNLDVADLLGNAPKVKSTQYTNAKVVLLGDTGVGKSGLAYVLTGHPFRATSSTHGRRVWTLDVEPVERDDGQQETREILLWDMAGQPGYRLVHQLHLTEVALALVLFDSRSETDPFAGVRHWVKALDQAQRVQGDSAPDIKKILVAARIDRGSVGVSEATLKALIKDMGFDGYVQTSALEGIGIQDLDKLIRKTIPWEQLPKVSSPQLFQSIKRFLMEEKKDGRILSQLDDLYRAFLLSTYAPPTETDELRNQFQACLQSVQSRGLIRLLNFGGQVLLQPELLDGYASALVNAAREEPHGFGCIEIEKAWRGEFSIPSSIKLKDPQKEQLLLLATVEDLVTHEIAVHTDSGTAKYLVFPSQFTRRHPDMPNPKGKAVQFTFDGPVMNVYSTLAVRLLHSGFFQQQEMWKNAVTYTTAAGGNYGMLLEEKGEGSATLTLFFDEAAPEPTRFQFEYFIETHLQRHALHESIVRERVFVCPACGYAVDMAVVKKRQEMGHDFVRCIICDEVKIPLKDRDATIEAAIIPNVSEMDQNADAGRDAQKALTRLAGQRHAGAFDVFMCHNSKDKEAVKSIARQLMAQGIMPWLDEWELQPGRPWQQLLQEQIEQIGAAAVFISDAGLGPWQDHEQMAFLEEFVKRDSPVIPVVLAGCTGNPALPPLLRNFTWVDFRNPNSKPLNRLIWGITGMKDKGLGGPPS